MPIDDLSGPNPIGSSGEWKLRTFSMSTGTQGDPASFREYEQFIARPIDRLAELLQIPDVQGWTLHTVIPESQSYTMQGWSTAGVLAANHDSKVAVLTMLKEKQGPH